ncbi:MAG: zinc ribbon domain-containing protein [Candidatus Pacearchaeota archaeon]
MTKCIKCGKEIEKKFKYCPYCGTKQLKGNLLDDVEDLMNKESFGFGFPFTSFNRMIKDLANQIEREMTKFDEEIKTKKTSPLGRKGISIKISFSNGSGPGVVIENIGEERGGKVDKNSKEIKKIKEINKKVTAFETLPREEAKTKVKRLSDRIIYEIQLNGVKSLDDVEIKQLENTTEVKAIAKDKIYFKLIPIVLPIINYELKGSKLYIYFKPEV